MYNFLGMQNCFDVLEWNRLLDMVAKNARTEIGRSLCLGLLPLEKDELSKEMVYLAEANAAYFLSGRFPIDCSSCLEPVLGRAEKGAALSEEELERICHDIQLIADLKRYFSKIPETIGLQTKLNALQDCSFLEEEIHRVIAPDLSIFDNASPKLKQIRVTLTRLEKQIDATLLDVLQQNKEFLSGDKATLRNGHYVLPVSNAHKNKVRGIVQDVSGSGGTTFIEPERLVQLNNQITVLRTEEREEIRRILLELSHKVGGCSDSLNAGNKLIGYLDFLQAKTLFGEEIHGHIGTLSEDQSLFIPSARHPLLDPERCVSNDFRILPGQRVIIISGPNAGGKTVALKTVGLLVLMFKAGLPLPCLSGAIIPYYREVFLDIGDSQSIQDNLSTFSGHMANIASILRMAGGKDLVLLDEVGTGTSPREGEALAKAIVKFLLSKHCTAMVSSHFEALKAFAFEHDDIENSSMLFDEEALLPTYKIKMGLPGESYGLKVAKRFGLPDSVIRDAEEDISKSTDLNVSDAIKRLGQITRESEELKARLQKKEAQIEMQERNLSIRENNLNLREEKLLAAVKAEKEALLQKARDQIDAIMAELASPEVKLHQAIAAKKRLESLEEKEREESFDTEVRVGDYVRIPSLDLVGRVARIQGKKVFLTTRDGMSWETTKDKVVSSRAPEEKKVKMKGSVLDSVGSGPSVGLELNIIGLHVDEALPEIDRYLDQCRRKGFERVRIIHGYGSGALRKATHEYLKSHASFVKKYELGGEFEGGSGATVVYLKSC